MKSCCRMLRFKAGNFPPKWKFKFRGMCRVYKDESPHTLLIGRYENMFVIVTLNSSIQYLFVVTDSKKKKSISQWFTT